VLEFERQLHAAGCESCGSHQTHRSWRRGCWNVDLLHVAGCATLCDPFGGNAAGAQATERADDQLPVRLRWQAYDSGGGGVVEQVSGPR